MPNLGNVEWPTIEIENWGQIVSFFEQIAANGAEPSFCFRGQSDAAWSLTPSIVRIIGDAGLTAEEAIAAEQSAVFDCRSQAHLFVAPSLLDSSPFDPNSDFGWWALNASSRCPYKVARLDPFTLRGAVLRGGRRVEKVRSALGFSGR